MVDRTAALWPDSGAGDGGAGDDEGLEGALEALLERAEGEAQARTRADAAFDLAVADCMTAQVMNIR